MRWLHRLWCRLTGRTYFVGVDVGSQCKCTLYAYKDRRGVLHVYREDIKRIKHPAEDVVERKIQWGINEHR